jgi:hypothetical protein
MVFIFKTSPFNMSFKEIRDMTFIQAITMITELKGSRKERQDAVSSVLRRSKDTMAVFDVTRGIYE